MAVVVEVVAAEEVVAVLAVVVEEAGAVANRRTPPTNRWATTALASSLHGPRMAAVGTERTKSLSLTYVRV